MEEVGEDIDDLAGGAAGRRWTLLRRTIPLWVAILYDRGPGWSITVPYDQG